MQSDYLVNLIRAVPDFPKPGIIFRDVTTLLNDRWGLKRVVDLFAEHYRYTPIDRVVGIESRGFVIGGALAYQLNAGFVLARKKGKLPAEVERQTYDLEYGKDTVEVHKDAIRAGEKCLVVDDLIATGGTCEATCKLIERVGGIVVGCAFIINLPDLKGIERLRQYDCHWLCEFLGH